MENVSLIICCTVSQCEREMQPTYEMDAIFKPSGIILNIMIHFCIWL